MFNWRSSGLIGLALLVLGGTAAEGQITLASSTLEERSARPGDQYVGVIRLRNESNEPQEVKLYQTDYAFFADGRTLFDAPGSTQRSNAAWIKLEHERVMIPPRAEAVATYTVKLPAAEASGSYWSVIMAELIERGSAESSVREQAARVEVGVRTSIRYAIQVATHLGGETARTARIENAHIARISAGQPLLEFDVVNTGAAAYRPELKAEVFDAEGRKVTEFGATRGLVYPGSSVRQRFDLSKLASGAYRVVLLADAGADEVFGAQYRFQLEDSR